MIVDNSFNIILKILKSQGAELSTNKILENFFFSLAFLYKECKFTNIANVSHRLTSETTGKF